MPETHNIIYPKFKVEQVMKGRKVAKECRTKGVTSPNCCLAFIVRRTVSHSSHNLANWIHSLLSSGFENGMREGGHFSSFSIKITINLAVDR